MLSAETLCQDSGKGERQSGSMQTCSCLGTGDLQGCACELHQGGVEAPGRRAAGHVQRCDAGEL